METLFPPRWDDVCTILPSGNVIPICVQNRKGNFSYQETVANIITISREAKDIFEKSSDIAGKRAFINSLIQNPTVNKKKLCFTIASPYNLVLELASTPNWLRTWNDVRLAIIEENANF